MCISYYWFVLGTGCWETQVTCISNTKLEKKNSTLPVGLISRCFRLYVYIHYTRLCFQGVLSHRLCLSYNPVTIGQIKYWIKAQWSVCKQHGGHGIHSEKVFNPRTVPLSKQVTRQYTEAMPHTEQAIQCNTLPIHFQQTPRRSLVSFPGILQVIKYWRWEWPGNEARESQWCALLLQINCLPLQRYRLPLQLHSEPLTCWLASNHHVDIKGTSQTIKSIVPRMRDRLP